MMNSLKMNPDLSFYQEQHERILQNLVAQAVIPAPKIREAMSYVLFSGGKRIRPLLVYSCGELFGLSLECLDILAAAIEIMHTYSLVHDDLPAMDNDDLRRGRPSCHRAFDEATAILVGDGLQMYSIELLTTQLPKFLEPQQILMIIQELAQACGPSGMVSGQSLDLSLLQGTDISSAEIEHIHQLKTGRLILACINMVLAAALAPVNEVEALRLAGQHLGILFQIQDDYLDRFGTKNVLGKGRSSDLANHKQTFASMYSQTALLELMQHHIVQIEQALDLFGDRCGNLQILMASIRDRL